jgi:hypothetical protein
MEFNNVIRKGLVFAGFSIALVLLPGSVSAQEITNTEFSDGPNVAAFAQPAASQKMTDVAATPAVPSTETASSVTATPVTSASLEPAAAQQNDEATSARLIWTGATLIWIGAIGMYLYGPAKRFAQELRAARNSQASTIDA